jgi:predicted membrane protein
MDFSNRKYNRDAGRSKCSKADGLPLIGVIFVGLGLVFLLDRLGMIPMDWHYHIFSWQALLIFLGVVNLFKSNGRLAGIILIIIGSVFLVPDLINLPFEMRKLIWPVVLISIGLVILFKARGIKAHASSFSIQEEGTYNHSEFLEEVAIFGGGKRFITSQNLKGGKITAIFGGLEIDLTDADLAEGTTVIEVAAIFGGVVIIVKPEWKVQIPVASILGSFVDKRKVHKIDVGANKELIIKGAAIFGGGEVKSY